MGNYKPYFKYIKDFTALVVFMFVVIILADISTSISTMIKGGENNQEYFYYTSQSIMMANILCTVAGFFYSMKLFSAAMSIRADRLGYIKAAFMWGLILAVGMTLFGSVIDALVKNILEVVSGIRVEILSQLMWIEIERFKASSGLLNKILSNLALFSGGFMIGAIMYRLKIKYNLMVFVGFPIIIIGYIANFGFKNPEKFVQIGTKILDTIEFLIKNQGTAIGVKCIILILCSIIGIRLLIKAPIKDYAHDLI